MVKVAYDCLESIKYLGAYNYVDSIADDRTCCIAHIWVPGGPSHSVSTYLSYIFVSYQVRSTFNGQSCLRLPGIY